MSTLTAKVELLLRPPPLRARGTGRQLLLLRPRHSLGLEIFLFFFEKSPTRCKKRELLCLSLFLCA